MEIDRGFSFDEEEEEEVMDEHDAPLQMARPSSAAAEESSYQPRCSVLLQQHERSDVADLRLFGERGRPGAAAELGEEEEEDEASRDVLFLIDHYVSSPAAAASTRACRCNNPSCSFRRYLHSRSRSLPPPRLNDLSSSWSSTSSSLSRSHHQRCGLSVSALSLNSSDPRRSPRQEHRQRRPLPELPPNSPREAREARAEFIQRAGGLDRVSRMYDDLMSLLDCQPDFLAPNRRDDVTLLMVLCCQPLSRHGDNTRIYLHIMATILALCSSSPPSPDLLFSRNNQDNTVLELAAITNKDVVVKYLALLYAPFSRDVNEANKQGHTVLHLLARKGDDSADALEALLGLEADGEKLLRIDVVNRGGMTPLDVAEECADTFTDRQTSYNLVIRLFYDTIEQQVHELYR